MATEPTATIIETPFQSGVATKLDGLAPDGDERMVIPQTVFDNLPGLLKELCLYFAEGFERDIFLTAAIVVFSGILSRVKFRHRDRWYHLNLYALVTAPAGSGKGDAGLAWNLAKTIDQRLYEDSLRAIGEWEKVQETIDGIKARNKKLKKGEPPEEVPELPLKPLIRTLRIAVNSSARAFIDKLEANSGDGILFDTEIKTLNLARKQEWGDTEAYLKGFHNEPINIDRAGGVSLRIDEPRFAAFLTGTPEASMRLIPGAEDGLFSRFIHYGFEAPIEWRSHRPSDTGEARDSAIARSAHTLDRLHEYLEQREEPLFVRLSDEQWDWIDEAFGGSTEAMKVTGTDNLLFASVRRAAIFAERIACIFTVLRQFERGLLSDQKSIGVESADIQNGIALAQTYLAHAIEIARKLPNASEANLTGSELRVYGALSGIPTTTEQIASKLGMSVRNAQRRIKTLCDYELARGNSDKGPYVKTDSFNLSPVALVASVASPEYIPELSEGNSEETTHATKATCDNFQIPF